MFDLDEVSFVSDPTMTETRVQKRERKWARRIKYQKWRRYDTIVESVPSNKIHNVGNKAFAHPEVIERIRNLEGEKAMINGFSRTVITLDDEAFENFLEKITETKPVSQKITETAENLSKNGFTPER